MSDVSTRTFWNQVVRFFYNVCHCLLDHAVSTLKCHHIVFLLSWKEQEFETAKSFFYTKHLLTTLREGFWNRWSSKFKTLLRANRGKNTISSSFFQPQWNSPNIFEKNQKNDTLEKELKYHLPQALQIIWNPLTSPEFLVIFEWLLGLLEKYSGETPELAPVVYSIIYQNVLLEHKLIYYECF